MKVKVESEKVGLKLISLCHLVPSLHGETDGETMETVRVFIFLDFKITADGDRSVCEIKLNFILFVKLKDTCSLE